MLSRLATRSRPSATDRVCERSRRLVRLVISFRPRRSASLTRSFRLHRDSCAIAQVWPLRLHRVSRSSSCIETWDDCCLDVKTADQRGVSIIKLILYSGVLPSMVLKMSGAMARIVRSSPSGPRSRACASSGRYQLTTTTLARHGRGGPRGDGNGKAVPRIRRWLCSRAHGACRCRR